MRRCRRGRADLCCWMYATPELFAAGHVLTASNLPHRRINQRNLAKYPKDALFVVYCSGPHCNGADKAALRLARLGRRVKKMIGGIEGWKDEGFELVTARKDGAKKVTQGLPNMHGRQSIELGGTE